MGGSEAGELTRMPCGLAHVHAFWTGSGSGSRLGVLSYPRDIRGCCVPGLRLRLRSPCLSVMVKVKVRVRVRVRVRVKRSLRV